MPKILIGVSILLLALSLLFGFLNTSKVKGLRQELETTTAARAAAQQARVTSDRKLKTREKDFVDASGKMSAAEAKAGATEAELTKAQNEKAELEAKLQTSAARIGVLEGQVVDATVGGVPGAPEGVSPNEMKAMLDDTKKQLEVAEQEKPRTGSPRSRKSRSGARRAPMRPECMGPFWRSTRPTILSSSAWATGRGW